MDTEAVNKGNFSVHDGDGVDQEAERDKVLTRVQLYRSSSSEKLLNLNVATKQGELQSFEKALEFDLMSTILCSEVKELQIFMAHLLAETVRARENLGGSFMVMEEKLLDSEESLKQMQEQVSDILTCFDDEENCKWNMGTRIKMRTTEQQRDILMILEKSLAREMNLEKKLSESRQVPEELEQKLLCNENKICCMEEEACNVWEKLFEADTVAEVLMGISKEVVGRIHILQLNLNCLLEQEDELKSKFETADQNLKSQESTLKRFESGETRLNDLFVAQTEILSEIEEKLILVSSEAFTLREKVTLLENQLKCSDAKVSAEETPKEIKHVVMVILVLLISAAVYLFQLV